MNDDAQLITSALDRRFARVAIPPCPDGVWRAATVAPASIASRNGLSRGLAYAAALVGVVAIGGLAAQAATSGKLHDMPFMHMFVSSKPLEPTIHKADRLTIAEAQRRIPFPIVVPTGLPADSEFLYAAVVDKRPSPRVALNYQAHIANRYYRIAVSESTAVTGPPRAYAQLSGPAGVVKRWSVPLRRWKHGDIFMEMVDVALPPGVSDRIVQANTM